jgi:hypothetical protein
MLAHLSPAEQRQLKRLLYRAGNPSTDDASPCDSPAELRVDQK